MKNQQLYLEFEAIKCFRLPYRCFNYPPNITLDSVNSSPSTSLLTPSICHKGESNKMDLKK